MGRIFTCLLLMELSVLVSLSPANGLSLDERVQQLSEDFGMMKNMLTLKDARLEELTKNDEEKDARLARLEETVRQQQIQIVTLQKELKTLAESSPSQLTTLNDQRPMVKSVSFNRTCRELRAADPSLASGMHWIDPDGPNFGDDPIYVYCDMVKGSTSVLHDTESAMDVGHCADPGCYSRPVNYRNATMKQMIALAHLSDECHQSIQYDCNYAPLQFNGISYSWWNDRNGTARYFWAGANSSVHTCQCGIDNNCAEATMQCNCDSTVPVPLTDNGVISDKSFLPITRLNFGRTQLASSSGIHKLGRFECTGQVGVFGMPNSCLDLWFIGHSLSGLYSVMGTERVESVFCDFTKLPTDPDFQKWIGQVDVKSKPVYFYVSREPFGSRFNTSHVPIPFEVEILNIGNAMNGTSGIFTAPRAGTYFFSFVGTAFKNSGDNYLYLDVYICLNGQPGKGYAYVKDSGTDYEKIAPISLQSTLSLKAGDQVWLQLGSIVPGTFLWYDKNYFNGWLLEEDITHSLTAN